MPFQHQSRRFTLLATALAGFTFSGCAGNDSSNNTATTQAASASLPTSELVQPVAACQPLDKPETGIQGQVPLADRQSGRSQQGYNCNLSRVGNYQGEGATWVNPIYSHCAYMGTAFNGMATKRSQGVQVVDGSDPTHPVLATNLTSPAFLIGPWESLKVNAQRQLLAGTAVGPILGAVFLDVYDISEDCANPKLLNVLAGTLTLPQAVLGHEGNFSPDGNTYWVTSSSGHIAAIDLSNASQPEMVYLGQPTQSNHGFEFSPDGNIMYAATISPTGVIVFDVSDIQNRKADPQVRELGRLLWGSEDGNTQSTIPYVQDGQHYLVAVDELDTGVVRILDINDPTKPAMVSWLKLAIHQPNNAQLRDVDDEREPNSGVGTNGLFGYEAHYCGLDSKVNPTALACSYFQSGVRVFDIRNPREVKEIAYYNPPAQKGKVLDLQGSEHTSAVAGQAANLSTDWCSSPPEFKNGNQLWVVCQDNGLEILEFAQGVYPLAGGANE